MYLACILVAIDCIEFVGLLFLAHSFRMPAYFAVSLVPTVA
ncbi:hypothetical protein B4153_6016 [Bacillus cereus]|nr:hypothetical protein B4153_6016 [Bacillus cereus]